MFKKLKAELKAVFKSKKTGSSKAKKGDLQPLQEQQQQQNLSQSYDGGLGRPWGLGGRRSVDVAHHDSEGKDAGAVLPDHLLSGNAVAHRISSPDCPPNQDGDEALAPWCRPNTNCQQQQQQLLSQTTQHSCQAGTSPDTPQSPQSPQALQAGKPTAADAVVPGAAAVGDGSCQAASNSCAGGVGKSSSRSGTGSRKHTSHAAAGASASRSTGPEPSRTPRDEDLGTCPPYATKAVWGLRYSMEDKWAAVPNLIQVPVLLTVQQSKPVHADTAGCGCIIKTSKVLAKVSPGCRGDKTTEHEPLVASHHGDEGHAAQGDLADSAALQELDSLHYFGVFDGHGGADAARHCAQRMHQVLADTVRNMLSPEVTVVVASAAAAGEAAWCGSDTASVPQQQSHQQPGETADSPPAATEPAVTTSAPGGSESAAASVDTAATQTTAQTPPEVDEARCCAEGTNSNRSSNDWTLATLAGSNGNWLSAALSKAFVNLDREFGVLSEGSYVGSTAVVVVLGTSRLWVAHAGDSRAVLGRRGSAVVLTSDHKASRDDEVARVQAAGGHVWWDRVMGELAVSRAIGDHCLRPYVIPEPEVSMIERCKDDEVLVMASDGLWDVINNQEAAEMALHTLHAAEAAGHVGVAAAKRAATSLTKAALDRGTRDNVTVLVVDLRARSSSNHNSSVTSSTAAVVAGGSQEKGGAVSNDEKPGSDRGVGLQPDTAQQASNSAGDGLQEPQAMQQQHIINGSDSSNVAVAAAVGAQPALS